MYHFNFAVLKVFAFGLALFTSSLASASPECDIAKSEFRSMLLDRNTLYLGVWGEEILCIYDVSVPESPAFVSMLDYRPRLSSGVTKMIKVGSYLYAGTDHRILIVDTNDPHSPIMLDHGIEGPSPEDFVLRDDRLYVGSGNNLRTAVRIYDVSNPAEPVQIQEIVGPRQWAAKGLGFNQQGNLVFSTNDIGPLSYGFVYDISDVQNPSLLAVFERSRWGVNSAVFANNYEVVVGDDGTRVFDHTNVSEIELKLFRPSSAFIRDVRVKDDYVVSYSRYGVSFFEVNKLPDLIVSKGISLGASGAITAVEVYDDTRAFVLDGLMLKLLPISPF